jgi:hypothetical protein
MPTNGDMSAAIASRSYEDSSGSQMKEYREKLETQQHDTTKLTESVEGKRLLESVRGVHSRLAKLLATAPPGTIATRIRRDLEDIRDSLNV